MTDIQQEAGMCARCWGKAFTAAYGIGSKTQAGEYERIVASCACTPAQRYGVADSFAAGYTARDKEMRQLRLLAEDQLTTLRKLKAEMLSDTRDKEIEELRARVEAVPVNEIRAICEWELGLDYPCDAAAALDRWLATVTK